MEEEDEANRVRIPPPVKVKLSRIRKNKFKLTLDDAPCSTSGFDTAAADVPVGRTRQGKMFRSISLNDVFALQDNGDYSDSDSNSNHDFQDSDSDSNHASNSDLDNVIDDGAVPSQSVDLAAGSGAAGARDPDVSLPPTPPPPPPPLLK
jgi:hypothetical protein